MYTHYFSFISMAHVQNSVQNGANNRWLYITLLHVFVSGFLEMYKFSPYCSHHFVQNFVHGPLK